MRFRTLLLYLMMAALGSGVARADDAQAKLVSRGLVLDATKQYQLADFEQALKLFKQAYDQYPFPVILYDIGQAERQLKRYDDALFHYRAYLRDEPAATNGEQVEHLIEDLKGLIAAQKASGERPPDGVEKPPGPALGTRAPSPARPLTLARTDPPPGAATESGPQLAREGHHRRWYSDPWGWTLVGAGVVATATGIWFLANASDLDDQARADQLHFAELSQRADDRRTVGKIALPIGAALIVAGVVKFAWPRGRAGSQKSTTAGTVGLGVAAGGGGWTGSIVGHF